MTEREAEIIRLIHQEVKPALGCTEPIAVALAVAEAVQIFKSRHCESIDTASDDWRLNTAFIIHIEVSGNILKNGMGVGIPGTGMIGLKIAAALGAVCGNPSYGLEVLKDLNDTAVTRAKQLVDEDRVVISRSTNCHKLYIKAFIEIDGCEDKSEAMVEDAHDRIVERCYDGIKFFSDRKESEDDECTSGIRATDLTIKEILEFAENAEYQDIAFILDDRKLNLALADEGLNGNYGLQVGKMIQSDHRKIFGTDFMAYAMSLTAAASDARMAGCTLPAMSNSGSGNQGITVSMPVIAYALKYGIDDERLARALIISNLVAIHIKGFLGKLSALCGCVVASTGSSCGIVWLKGGEYKEICAAIKNMIGNITGMVCDGAKVGCAMKVASGVSCSIQSAMLALDGICVCETDGIIDKDIEKTICNLGKIGSVGMQDTDEIIQDIMICK